MKRKTTGVAKRVFFAVMLTSLAAAAHPIRSDAATRGGSATELEAEIVIGEKMTAIKDDLRSKFKTVTNAGEYCHEAKDSAVPLSSMKTRLNAASGDYAIVFQRFVIDESCSTKGTIAGWGSKISMTHSWRWVSQEVVRTGNLLTGDYRDEVRVVKTYDENSSTLTIAD